MLFEESDEKKNDLIFLSLKYLSTAQDKMD